MSGAVTSLEAETSPVEAYALRRADRYEAREYLWRRSKIDRVKQCGRFMLSSAVAVKVSTEADGSRRAGYSNLEHCGSVWSCPVCSARINDTRSKVLAEALHRWDARGGKVCMVTLTVRHNAGQSLAQVWDAVAEAWRRAIGGQGFARAADQWAMVTKPSGKPWVPFWRVYEVTHGVNGWHVHVHALFLVHGQFTDVDARSLGYTLWKRWDAAAQKAGMAAGEWDRPCDAAECRCDKSDPDRHRKLTGAHAEVVKGDPSHALGDYFSKAVYEVTGARFKTGALRGDHRTPWGILGALVKREGTVKQRKRWLSLWWEWEEASHGRRQMGRSRGLLALLGMDEWEPSDQDIVDAPVEGDEVSIIGPDLWRWICRTGKAAAVLDGFERSYDVGRSVLDAIWLEWCADSPPAGDCGVYLVPGEQTVGPDLLRAVDLPPVRLGERSPDQVRSLYGVCWQPALREASTDVD